MVSIGQFNCSVSWHFYLEPVHVIAVVVIHIAKMPCSCVSALQFLGFLPGVVGFGVIGIGNRHGGEVAFETIATLTAVSLDFDIIGSRGTVAGCQDALSLIHI